MADQSSFKRGQVDGASGTKTVDLFGVQRNTLPKVMTAFEKEGKTSSLKHNSGRKRKLSYRDRRTFRGFFRKITRIQHYKSEQSLMIISRKL